MNAKAAVKLVDPLEDQRQIVRELNARIDKLTDSITALQARTGSADTISAQLAELEAANEAAVSAWADKGANGEPPAADHAKLRKLQDELSAAQADQRAAQAALDKQLREHSELHRQLVIERGSLRRLALEELAREAQEHIKAFHDSLFAADRNREYLSSLRNFIQQCRAQGDSIPADVTDPLDQALNLHLLAPTCDEAVANAHRDAKAHWTGRLDALTAE